MLVAVGFYLGQEKTFEGAFPITVLACTTISAMVSSELVARLKKVSSGSAPIHSSGPPPLMFNLIPFKNLNVIFAILIMVRTVATCLRTTEYGYPNLSIQATLMVSCLLCSSKTSVGRIRSWLAAGTQCSSPGQQEQMELEEGQLPDQPTASANQDRDSQGGQSDQFDGAKNIQASLFKPSDQHEMSSLKIIIVESSF